MDSKASVDANTKAALDAIDKAVADAEAALCLVRRRIAETLKEGE